MTHILSETAEFVPPPEAPVFEPTWDEFKDPAAYIEKIKDVGAKTGIIKIRPPPSWQPPFAVDVENFTFVPRLQKLNELEARSRVKLNFLDRVLKYWHLQGVTLKVPLLEKRILDLYKLHKVVEGEGGFEHVCTERKWLRVAEQLGYTLSSKGIGSTLRHHYERILYPFDLFNAGASVLLPKVKTEINETDAPVEKCEAKPAAASRMMTKPSSSITMKRVAPKETPKPHQIEQKVQVIEKTADQYFCEVCNGGDNDELMLLCDGCDDAYHTFCLTPPMAFIPPGDWRCPRCIAKECSKPTESYGFEEAQHEYSLYSFGAKADQFKSDYFKKSGQMVSTTEVEKEFWRLVSSLDDDVVVEYGADIHALEKGSGFPTEKTRHRFPGYEEYISSGWNLNNLPVMGSSVLRYVNVDISGMKVPWCYVGMCFTCFCWHTEDHWSYSVNYMHWGEPKTWYGVPGTAADLLEECIQKSAGELFENAPDLLHQLTTIINPNVLMNYGVPIYRTDQCAGEFVVTFPRSYHAGFNQGYNFAEAVNYCPPDWLPWGRSCIDHYRTVNRQCVFSHDELLCIMTLNPSKLDIRLAKLLVTDLKNVFERENKLRDAISEQGVKVTKEVDFEKLSDDERQCTHCQTTVFLSAFTCCCDDKKMWCIDHTEWPSCECKPSDWHLLYRYTADEMSEMIEAVSNRSNCLERWIDRANAVLATETDEPTEFSELKAIASEVTADNIPAPADLLRKLNNIVHEAEECIVVAGRLTRRRGLRGNSEFARNLNLDEVRNFCARVDAVPCHIKEANVLKVQELLKCVESYQAEVQEIIKSSVMPTSAKLKQLMDHSLEIDIEIAEAKSLKWMLDQSLWLEEVCRATGETKKLTLTGIGRLVDDGSKLEKPTNNDIKIKFHSSCSKTLSDLRKQQSTAKSLEKLIQSLLEAESLSDLSSVESALSDCEKLTIHLPCVERLKSVHQKALKWISSVQSLLQRRDHDVHVGEIEHFLNERAQIPISLDLSKPLDTKISNVKLWKVQVSKTFNIRSTSDTLLKVIFPLVNTASSVDDLKLKTKDDMQCDSGSSLLDMLKSLEKQSIEEIVKKQTENLAQIVTEDCTKTPKTMMDLSRNQCVLCDLNFIEEAYKLRESDTRPSSGEVIEECFCSSCRHLLTGRPSYEDVARLVNAWKQLQVCVQDGRSLAWLIERVAAWRAELNHQLEISNLSAEFKAACQSGVPHAAVIPEQFDPGQVPDAVLNVLQSLLVRAVVLGMNLEETDGLTRMLSRCHQHKLDCQRKKLQLELDIAKQKKKKRKSSDSSRGSDLSVEKVEPTTAKKQKEKSGANKDSESKKKRSSKTSSKKCRKSSKGSSDSSNDSYDTCSAKSCIQPVGSKINWVQCDGCELWYHLVCVGLIPSQVADDSYEYHCDECQRMETTTNKSAVLEASPVMPVPTSLTVSELLLRASSVPSTTEVVRPSQSVLSTTESARPLLSVPCSSKSVRPSQSVANFVETVRLSPVASSRNYEPSALDLTTKTLSAQPAQAGLNLQAKLMSLSDVIASAQPVSLANFISSAKPLAGPGSISSLQPVFSPVVQQRHIGLVASFTQPTFGLLTSVGQQFGNVGIKPLDYRNPIAAALTNSSQGGAERTVTNTLAAMPGNGLASRPSISINQGGAERTVTNALAAMPGNGLASGPSLSFGQYLYGPWINNNNSGNTIAPR